MRYEARAVAWSSGLDSDEPTVNWCVVKVCVSWVIVIKKESKIKTLPNLIFENRAIEDRWCYDRYVGGGGKGEEDNGGKDY